MLPDPGSRTAVCAHQSACGHCILSCFLLWLSHFGICFIIFCPFDALLKGPDHQSCIWRGPTSHGYVDFLWPPKSAVSFHGATPAAVTTMLKNPVLDKDRWHQSSLGVHKDHKTRDTSHSDTWLYP
jgi:hypothetical protein